MSMGSSNNGMFPAAPRPEEFLRIISEIGSKIASGKSFWIFCHESPDGDTIGCSLAMYAALRNMGKDAHVFSPDVPPRMYQFLPYAPDIELTNMMPEELPDVVIFTDNASFTRVGKRLSEELAARGIGPGSDRTQRRTTTINIDHHVSNERYGDINLIDPSASACGELFFNLFKALRLPITREMAINIYATILTDTGRFSYGNTNQQTFQVASELIAIGVNPFEVVNSVYNTRSDDQIRLLAMILDTITPVPDLGYFYCVVNQAMLEKTGTEISDTDGAVDIMKTVGGYDSCFLLKEEADGGVKVSARSNQRMNVNLFAHRFGGGGHPAASGFRMPGPLSTAPQRLHQAMQEHMESLSGEASEASQPSPATSKN